MSRVAFVISFDRTERDGVPIEEIKVDIGAPGDDVDPTTHEQHLPPGEDSAPLPGDQALLVEVEGGAGEEAIVAYSDPKNAGITQAGEKRLYARNSDGDIVVSIHLKGDGSMVIGNENGTVTLEADGSVSISGDLNVAGSVAAKGDMAADGEVTAKALVPAASVSLSTHLHGFTGASGPVLTPTPGT